MRIHRDHQTTTPAAPRASRSGRALRVLFLTGASIAAIASPSLARAADCSITYSADDQIGDVIEREHFGFEGYDALCAALQAAHLKVVIEGDKGVLDDRAFAWVNIRLARKSTTVTSDFARQTTKIITPADDATASKAVMDAINESLENIATEKDKYIQSVAAEEARLRAALTARAADKP